MGLCEDALVREDRRIFLIIFKKSCLKICIYQKIVVPLQAETKRIPNGFL